MIQRTDQRADNLELPPLAGRAVDEIKSSSRPLRIMLFAKSKKHTRVPDHFIRAFRSLGHEVQRINTLKVYEILGRKLGARYMRWRYRRYRPDMVWIWARDIPMLLLNEIDVPKIVFYEDVPHNNMPHERSLEVFQKSTLFYTTNRGLLDHYKTIGIERPRMLHAGCERTDHFLEPQDMDYAGGVAFIGKGRGQDRIDLMHAIHKEFPIKLYGSGWKENGIAPVKEHVYADEYRKICSSAAILIGIDPHDDIDLYFSNRTWLTLGCGGFLLTRYIPSLEELFHNHHHLVWYKSTEECLDLIRYYLEHESEREQIARQGYEYVQSYHTFRHAAAQMIQDVESLS